MMSVLHTRLFGLLATAWGGLMIYFYYSGRLFVYLDISFHHFVMMGGIGMTILGLYSVICPRPSHDHVHTSCDHDHEHHHGHGEECGHHHEHDHHHEHGEECDHDHDEGHGPIVTILLTIIPLTIAMTQTKDGLSTRGLAKKGLYESPNIEGTMLPPFTREDLERDYPKNASGDFQLPLIWPYYAAGDREVQGILEGLPVEFEGRIAPEKINNESGNRLRIFQKIITCCAADLQVVGVSIEFPEGIERPKLDSWSKAAGVLTFEKVGSRINPLLKVREVFPAEEPYNEFIRRQ